MTEYKPSTRRQLPATRHAQSFSMEAASPNLSEGGRFDATSRGGDSYGAALRAADALFSPPKGKPSADQPSIDRPSPDAGEAPGGTGGARAAGRGSGRILRVIDEPAPEPTVGTVDEPDGEPAPKRRGRKPGSKNRPKVDGARAALAAAPDVGERRPAPSPLATPGEAASAAGTDAGADSLAAPVTANDGPTGRDHAGGGSDAAVREPAEAADVAEPVAALPSRERRRFSWVRTKLKPGQEWKRRLPKVCW